MRRPRWAGTLVWAVLAALALAIVARATYTADLSAFLPREPTQGQRLLVEQLRSGLASRLIMVAIEGSDAPGRARVAADLARRLRADHAFVSVSDGDTAYLADTTAFVFAHRYLLSDAVTPQRFTVPGLHAAIADTLDLLASPEGLLIKPLFTRDPTGETLHILDSLGPQPLPTLGGVWSSRDGRRALLVAETRAAGTDTDAQERACAAIRRAFAATVAGLSQRSGAPTLRMSGPGVFAVTARSTIRSQVIGLSALSLSLIAALLFAAYRSVPALLLTFVPVASGALAGVAAVALGFGTVHGLTLGFGVTLIGEAVDYSIYLFVQSAPQPAAAGAAPAADGAPWRQVAWPTIRLGMLTSVCGFAALVPSGFSGLAQLGLYSIAGLVAAALVTRWVLPEWLPRSPRPKQGTRDLSALGARLWRALAALRPARAALALVPLLAGAVLFTHRDGLLSHELSDLSPIGAAAQALDAKLRGDLGAPDAGYLVVVTSSDPGVTLAAAQGIATRLTQLTEAHVIGGFESPTRYLPAPGTQRERTLSLPAGTELAALLPRALAGLPVNAARLEPFVGEVDQARRAAPLTMQDFAGTPLAAAVDALLSVNDQAATAFLPITAPGRADLAPDEIAQLRTAVAAARRVSRPGTHPAQQQDSGSVPVEAHVLDLKAEADQLYAHYLAQAVWLSLAGLAAILLMLLLARGPASALRVVTPLALAVLTVAAALAVAGQPLGILHIVGMLLIIAVGSNYALFLDRLGQPEPGTVPRILASLAIANLATVAGFGVLALSSVPVLAALGRTVAPGALLALLFAALLAPLGAPPRPGAPPAGTRASSS